jgi:protein dithiol oxidoreductase (disulfide-forming)
MRLRALPVLLGVALLALTACGRQESSGLAPAKAPGPATTPAVKTSAAAIPGKTAADASKPLTMQHLNEDGSESVEETPGDTSAQNKLLAAVASTVAAATSSSTAMAASGDKWVEGVNYTRVVPAQPTSAPAGQVEVLEFFWYACPHCFALEPTVVTWLKNKPAYITFTRVPIEWNEGHRSLARLYYALDGLGKINDVHAEIFKEIQVNNDPLIGADPNNSAAAERTQLSFVRKLGISDSDFSKAYHDMNTEIAMQRADQLAQRFRITGVPSFVINGKYVTDLGQADPSARDPNKLMALISDLAAQEHKH